MAIVKTPEAGIFTGGLPEPRLQLPPRSINMSPPVLADNPNAISYSNDPLDPRHLLVLSLFAHGYNVDSAGIPTIFGQEGKGFTSLGFSVPNESAAVVADKSTTQQIFHKITQSDQFKTLLDAYQPIGVNRELFRQQVESGFSSPIARGLLTWLYWNQRSQTTPDEAETILGLSHDEFSQYANEALRRAGFSRTPTQEEFMTHVFDRVFNGTANS